MDGPYRAAKAASPHYGTKPMTAKAASPDYGTNPMTAKAASPHYGTNPWRAKAAAPHYGTERDEVGGMAERTERSEGHEGMPKGGPA